MKKTRVLAVSVEPQLIELRQSFPGRETLVFFRVDEERLGPSHIGWLRQEGVAGDYFRSVAICGYRSLRPGYGILDIMQAAYLCGNCHRRLEHLLDEAEEEPCIDRAR